MQVDLLALQPDILLLAYNDDSVASRSTLLLAMSTDEGSSWHDIAVLEADPRGSFHYPTLYYQQEKVGHTKLQLLSPILAPHGLGFML